MRSAEPVRPFANTRIAKLINERINQLKNTRSQRDIALAIGYTMPNNLSMVKRGETKLPVSKLPALAKALEVDPAHLMRLALEDYLPGLANAIEQTLGYMATKNEYEFLLKPWREGTQNSDPSLNDELSAAINQFLRKIRIAAAKVNPQ